MELGNAIRVTCQGSCLVEVDDIDVIQGDLKTLNEQGYLRLRQSILKHGFFDPFSLWKGEDGRWKILDGTQRKRTLLRMRDEGIKIPALPANVVEAENETDAREKLIAQVSQFGKVTGQGLFDFLEESNIDRALLDDYDIPGIDTEKFTDDFYNPPEPPKPPTEFPEVNGAVKVTKTCPSCGFQWN